MWNWVTCSDEVSSSFNQLFWFKVLQLYNFGSLNAFNEGHFQQLQAATFFRDKALKKPQYVTCPAPNSWQTKWNI